MGDRIVKQNLKDGSRLEIYCRRFPGSTDVPNWFRAVFGVPDGLGWGVREPSGERYLGVSGWERYYRDVFTGKSAGECTDYLYGALVDGRPAGRMWFGFSNRTGCGNFGNVETIPEFRRRGVMGAMLRELVPDFMASGARFISCGAEDAAAPAYAAMGFRRILGEDNHAMALMGPDAGSFADVLRLAYGSNRNAVIREGKRGDRFDLDKLLAYAPETAFQKALIPDFFREQVPDYLHAFQQLEPGRSALPVIEAASGFCAGYAYAEKILPGVTGVTFTVHPAFYGNLAELLQHAVQGLGGRMLVFPGSADPECGKALRTLGLERNQYGLWDGRKM